MKLSMKSVKIATNFHSTAVMTAARDAIQKRNQTYNSYLRYACQASLANALKKRTLICTQKNPVVHTKKRPTDSAYPRYRKTLPL